MTTTTEQSRSAAVAQETATDHDAIVEVAQSYYDGMFHHDEDKLRKAFHPDAFIIGHFGGGLIWNSLDAFIDYVMSASEPPGDDAYDCDVESVEITGDVATAKVVNRHVGLMFTDYLNMLKHDDRWMIINKAFYQHPEA